MPQELSNLKVQRLDAVDEPSTARKFLLVKADLEGGENGDSAMLKLHRQGSALAHAGALGQLLEEDGAPPEVVESLNAVLNYLTSKETKEEEPKEEEQAAPVPPGGEGVAGYQSEKDPSVLGMKASGGTSGAGGNGGVISVKVYGGGGNSSTALRAHLGAPGEEYKAWVPADRGNWPEGKSPSYGQFESEEAKQAALEGDPHLHVSTGLPSGQGPSHLDIFYPASNGTAVVPVGDPRNTEPWSFSERVPPVVVVEEFLRSFGAKVPATTEAPDGEVVAVSASLEGGASYAPDQSGVLVAGNYPVSPPSEWFQDPGLQGPTPLTIEDDGRVYGHAALWKTCHTGYPGQCVPPPKGNGYSHFMVGAVRCETGDCVPVGKITMATGHPDLKLNASQATAHYDHTGAAVADVAVGEDAHGIWFSGSLRPDITDSQRRTLLASPLSGDWRPIQGRSELVGLLAVNVPGFPVPRVLAASGAIVAAGAFSRDMEDAMPSEVPFEQEFEVDYDPILEARIAALEARELRKELELFPEGSLTAHLDGEHDQASHGGGGGGKKDEPSGKGKYGKMTDTQLQDEYNKQWSIWNAKVWSTPTVGREQSIAEQKMDRIRQEAERRGFELERRGSKPPPGFQD